MYLDEIAVGPLYSKRCCGSSSMQSILLDLEGIAEWTFDDWGFVPGMEMGTFGSGQVY